LSPETTLRKILYVLLNPVEACLVRCVRDWAGPSSWNTDHPRSARVRAACGLAHAIHMWHVERMGKMIQVRNVPTRLHRELTRRAKARGQTLTQYVQAVLEREVATPPREEVFARISRAARVKLSRPAADLIAEERASRA
jgi:hypothetical protein